MTIHKSQGGTFDQIVYEYDKIHPQQIVYVALSHVTSIEGLFIVTFDDDETKFRFHHNRVQASSTISLVQEFQRLSLNKLETKAKSVIDFITRDKGISLCTFNVQSLRKHSVDLIDSVTEKTNILLLSETWLDNREECDIPNFNCITHFKRDFVRSVGVAIYHNINDTTNLVTPNMSVIMNNIQDLHFLEEEFDLRINNNPAESTTKYNTTIDAVFSRHLNKIESQTYVSYFSYHKPIITKIEPTD
ncbi:unnamed protein product [Euphydryas editha]|uniref:Uncharacterized protein n=1 Tax=Euphydryas editha TaxID=104508 RepID=A0AAU9VAU0_EUPED|nr:unnamed protein product [Euphydryas editha]